MAEIGCKTDADLMGMPDAGMSAAASAAPRMTAENRAGAAGYSARVPASPRTTLQQGGRRTGDHGSNMSGRSPVADPSVTRERGDHSPGPFVLIPAGWFLMGSDDGPENERPSHRVWVDAFEMADTPVTRREYEVFLAATGHEPPREWQSMPAGADRPVIGVSWFDCEAYCQWQSSRNGPVRLPTEAEWERAARGGVDGRRYPWGDEVPPWIPNGGQGPVEGPWPVTLGEPNAFGLHGIAANVHEWCRDWYDAGYYRQAPDRNPAGPATGVRKASRGGSWRHAITISRCAARSAIAPSFRYTDYGFRLARDL
jgi:formylglycine-generating enzyme required for sulfatase activity